MQIYQLLPVLRCEVERMRELTFRGFLTQYVKQLAAEKTNSLYKLAAEAGSNNPRLREPLLLYAVYTQKERFCFKQQRNLICEWSISGW